MKRKFVAALLLSTFVLTLFLVFAGCGKNDKQPSPGQGEKTEEGGGGNRGESNQPWETPPEPETPPESDPVAKDPDTDW